MSASDASAKNAIVWLVAVARLAAALGAAAQAERHRLVGLEHEAYKRGYADGWKTSRER